MILFYMIVKHDSSTLQKKWRISYPKKSSPMQQPFEHGRGAAGHHACLLVLTHSLLEKVGLALQGNHLHPGPWHVTWRPCLVGKRWSNKSNKIKQYLGSSINMYAYIYMRVYCIYIVALNIYIYIYIYIYIILYYMYIIIFICIYIYRLYYIYISHHMF